MKEIVNGFKPNQNNWLVDIARNKLYIDLLAEDNTPYFNLLLTSEDDLDNITTPTVASIIRRHKKVYIENFEKRTKKEVVDPDKILGQMSFSFTLDM